MSNVIPFPQSPLARFTGKWVLDQFSVSRKLAKRFFGEAGYELLAACGSMDEVRQCLQADPGLALRYEQRLALAPESTLLIGPRSLQYENFPAGHGVTVLPVLRTATEGRSLVVTTNQRYGTVLRMKKEWLLVSERYDGRDAQLFPRSPIFRWYRVALP